MIYFFCLLRGNTVNYKINVKSELVYVFAVLLLSFAVAMCAAADFGVSMIVAPAYILHLRIPAISFGQAEYILQAVLFIVFCLLKRKFKPVYLFSFFTCLFYGLVLDLWRIIIPAFRPEAAGALPMPARIVFFIISMFLTSFSVTLFFQTYLYPQVWDFFVKGISAHFRLDRSKFKIAFDFSCLALSLAMTLLFFGEIRGIGIGTVILTLFNGLIIAFFNKQMNKHLVVTPIFPKAEKVFSLED